MCAEHACVCVRLHACTAAQMSTLDLALRQPMSDHAPSRFPHATNDRAPCTAGTSFSDYATAGNSLLLHADRMVVVDPYRVVIAGGRGGMVRVVSCTTGGGSGRRWHVLMTRGCCAACAAVRSHVWASVRHDATSPASAPERRCLGACEWTSS